VKEVLYRFSFLQELRIRSDVERDRASGSGLGRGCVVLTAIR
jgi:hypothetical protein